MPSDSAVGVTLIFSTATAPPHDMAVKTAAAVNAFKTEKQTNCFRFRTEKLPINSTSSSHKNVLK